MLPTFDRPTAYATRLVGLVEGGCCGDETFGWRCGDAACHLRIRSNTENAESGGAKRNMFPNTRAMYSVVRSASTERDLSARVPSLSQ
jgi:hypothetical protein